MNHYVVEKASEILVLLASLGSHLYSLFADFNGFSVFLSIFDTS